MCTVSVNIPNEVLYDIKMTENDANEFVKQAVALMMYKKNHVSIGYCSQIAGMNEEDFIKYLGSNNISIFNFDTQDEFAEEMKNA